MIGAVIILIVMFLVGPFAVFIGGALWSALVGWLFVSTTDPALGAAAETANQG